jgi:chromosome segregation ATPase
MRPLRHRPRRTGRENRDNHRVADGRAQSLLALAAELERRDEEIAAQIELVAELATRVGTLRERAMHVRAQLAALPAELTSVESADAVAREAEREARSDLAAAEARLAALEGSRRPKQDDLAQARRSAVTAREVLGDALTRIDRLAARRAELQDVERALSAEAEGLTVEARAVATGIREAPRVSDAGKAEPGQTLEEIDQWGGIARAALFVAHSTLETDREKIVVEAHALGASVLGEQPAGTSVAVVRRRLEQTFGN